MPGDDVGRIALLDASGEAAQVGGGDDGGRQCPIDRDRLVEFQIRLRETRDRRALRRDRGPGDHSVAGTVLEPREDAVEILARVGEWPQFEREPAAHRTHELDVEPGRDPILHHIKGRIRIGRNDRECAGD